MKLMQVYDHLSVELEEVRDIFDQTLQSDISFVCDMLEEVSKFRGKMLRPVLVLLSGKAFGRITPKHHVVAAVAEMVHMATLVHDDVLDEADHRRRGQTINALHGNEAAVMLGDLLFSHAFRLSSNLESPYVIRLLAATSATICEGELMQLTYRGYHDLDEARYIEMVQKKTASLIASCSYLGAYACGADQNICAAMERFGLNLGIAFQIMDDVMDLTGDEKEAGKTLGIDLLKEKLTLPVIHYLAHCKPHESQWLRSVLSEHRQVDFAEVVAKLVASGSVAYARQKAEVYVQRGQESLPAIEHEDTRLLLHDLANMVVA